MLTPRVPPRGEQGVVTVLFALFLGLLLMFGSLVITIGSWYTHARQLQTKADAAALAGGGTWSFPCTPETDARIATTARTFFGEHTAAPGAAVPGDYNQQVGGVEGDQVYVTLNQAGYWQDTFPSTDFSSPSGPVCASLALDVKATEDDSPLLWGWLPFLPDIKKKARVEIEKAEGGLTDLLPIAVRVPKPVSSAAVIYDESNGNILSVRYFQEDQGVSNLPAGLDGFSTRLSGTPDAIPSLPVRTGVLIALSFRPACGAPGAQPPCFEDDGWANVNALCNQGSGAPIVTCYDATGNWPSQSARSGLHFIRSYGGGNVTNGPPALRSAWLGATTCESNAYFNSLPTGSCLAQLNVAIDIGSVVEDVGGGGDDDDDDDGGDGPEQTRKGSNVEVRYRLVRSDGTTFCNYGDSCELVPSSPDATGTVTYTTSGSPDSPNLPLTANSRGNSVAIQIRVRRSTVAPNPGGCGPGANFNNNCRWFHLGSGNFGPGTPPTTAQIQAAPVQRAFMGNIDLSGPVKWLQIGRDVNCDDVGEAIGGPAASHQTGVSACFFVDMGLKGGIAKDQDEPPFVFDEGTGSSQMGFLDCDPAFGQGQQLTDAVVNGCGILYTGNKFNTSPLCPGPNQFFTLPKPAPFDDWAPFDCVKTRPTGAGNQIVDGLNERIFGVRNNPSCPADNGGGYVEGRNYWHRANNGYDAINYAWDNDTPGTNDDLGNRLRLDDPRLVTLFFSPYQSFGGSGQEVFPVVALGAFYVTGWGRLNGNGTFQGGGPADPCTDGNNGNLYDGTGNEPPPDLNANGGAAGGTVVWGHFLKYVAQSSQTSGGGEPCDPDGIDPCVAVLVE
jgi:Putative Flp pilus-assembly TadE/G-like